MFRCKQGWMLWTGIMKWISRGKKIVHQTGQRAVQDWRFALEYFLKLDSVVSAHGFGFRQERQ